MRLFPILLTSLISATGAVAQTGYVEFASGNYYSYENEEVLVVQVVRQGGSEGQLSVVVEAFELALSASPGEDFEEDLFEVVFEAGEDGVQEVYITLYNDDISEGDESFGLSLYDPDDLTPIGDLDFAVAVILDDDLDSPGAGVIGFENDQFGAIEGLEAAIIEIWRDGPPDVRLEAELSTFSLDRDLGVDLALEGEDYQKTCIPIVFEPNSENYLQVLVPIINDDQAEQVEFFGVALHNPDENTDIGSPNLAAVAIIDDDGLSGPNGAMRLTATEYHVEEGKSLRVTVERVGNSNGSLEGYIVADEVGDSATADEDFEFTEIHIEFGPGEMGTRSVTIKTLDDDEAEGPEYFAVGVLPDEDEGAVTPPFLALVEIEDNEANQGVPDFDQEEYYADESSGSISFTIYREGGTEGQLDFWFAAIDVGSACGGKDFEEVRKPLSFPAGSDEPLTVEVPIFDDQELELTDDEPFEYFVVGVGYSNDPEDVLDYEPVLILDNDLPDAPGRIILNTDWYSAYENEGEIKVTALRVLGRTGRLEARLTTRSDSAKAGSDFEQLDTLIVFEDGETGRKDFTVKLIDDAQAENLPESFFLSIPSEDEPFEAEAVIYDDDLINTKILTPINRTDLGAGVVSFEAMVENQTNQDRYTFDWEICPSTGGDCRTASGRATQLTLDQPGIYLVACYAGLDGEIYDVTPDVIGIRISGNQVTARITRPTNKELEIAPGKTVAFVAESAPADVQGFWYFLSDPKNRFPGNVFRHTFTQVGEDVVIFEAVDPATGQTASDYIEVEVGGQAVALNISAPLDGTKVKLGDSVQFRGTVTGPLPKRMETKIAWVIDGNRLEGLAPLYTFNRAGLFDVRLIGETPAGRRFEDQIVIFVEDRATASIVDFNFPTDLNISPGQDVFFQARVLENKGYQLSDLVFEWQIGSQKSNLATPGKVSFLRPGTYQVSLSARVRATGLQSQTVTRTITVGDTQDSALEPNESIAQAVALTPGNYGSLLLDEQSGIDVFKVRITSTDQRLVFELNPVEPVIAEILDSNQTQLEIRTITGSQNLQLSGLTPGDYFIRLTPLTQTSLKRRAGLTYSLNVAVLNPALYLPEIRVDSAFTTDVGIVNPTGETASIQLVGYDERGNIVKTITMELTARARLHRNMEQLFGEDARLIHWVQVDSTRDLVGYSRTASRDAREVYGISASRQLRSELFVPHIAEQTNQWFTRSSVVNGSQRSSKAEIQTPVNKGLLNLEASFANDSFEYVDRLGGTLPEGAKWATLKETNGQPSLAGVEVFGMLDKNTRQIAGLELSDVRQDNPNFTYIGNNLYFSHIARNVAQFWTGIALVNISQIDQTVRIRAFGTDGVEIGSSTLNLLAGEKKVQLAEDFLQGIGSPANVDWALVEADQEIVGYELFGTLDFKKIAGLEAITGLRKQICYPFIDINREVAHGIAVVNVNPTSQAVSFTLYSNSGKNLASVNRTLKPNEKMSITIEELFKDFSFQTGEVPGWMECKGEAPLAGFELFLNTVNNEQMGALLAQ